MYQPADTNPACKPMRATWTCGACGKSAELEQKTEPRQYRIWWPLVQDDHQRVSPACCNRKRLAVRFEGAHKL